MFETISVQILKTKHEIKICSLKMGKRLISAYLIGL